MDIVAVDDVVVGLGDLGARGAPRSEGQLNRRLEAIADAMGVPVDRARRLLGAVIVAQMLPEGVVVKGGNGVRLRHGATGTRATRDLDLLARDPQQALKDLTGFVDRGWGAAPGSKRELKADPAATRVAFFGTVHEDDPAEPLGVPDPYVLSRAKVTLHFLSARTSWVSVPIEIGRDEFEGSTLAQPVEVVAPQVAEAVTALGCGTPRSVAVMAVEQQLAQKIHAVTDPHQTRGHDLVDIQLLWHGVEAEGGVDIPLLADLVSRTFMFRSPGRTAAGHTPHEWPPPVAHVRTLEQGYLDALEETRVGAEGQARLLQPRVSDAADWLESLITRIARAAGAEGSGAQG